MYKFVKSFCYTFDKCYKGNFSIQWESVLRSPNNYIRGSIGVALREVYLEKVTFQWSPKSWVGGGRAKREKKGTLDSRALRQQEFASFKD